MKPKNNFWPKRLAASLILATFLMAYLPAAGGASHSVSIEVDRPNGYYFGGVDKIAFTAENTGDDDAYVSCTHPIEAYKNPQGGQQQEVAQEPISSCYVLQGIPSGQMLVAYKLAPGETRAWQWDQKDFNGNQVPDERYVGKISTNEDGATNIPKHTFQSSNFWIETDKDGDGLIGPDDKCPDVKPRKDVTPQDGCEDDRDFDGINDAQDKCPVTPGRNTPHPENPDWLGCPDIDDDGVADKTDDGKHPDKCTPPGGPLFPEENYAEDYNDYKDKDGCPDERQKQAIKATAVVMYSASFAAGHAATEFGLVSLWSPWTAGSFFVLEAVFEISAHYFWEIVIDPPDTTNYKEIFVPKLPSVFTSEIISSQQPDLQMLLDGIFESANLAKAFRISVERHIGAMIMNDYKAALAQAKAVRDYAAQSSESLTLLADDLEMLAANDDVRAADLEKLKQTARDFRQKLLEQGTDAIPEVERKVLESEGEEGLLPLMYYYLTDESMVENMKHPSEQFVATADKFRDMAQTFDYESKTYGSNIYLATSENDGKINVGAYYESAPNEVNKFMIELRKPANTKFVKLLKDSNFDGWAVFALQSKNKLKIIAVNPSLFGSAIKSGSDGMLFDLEFEPLAGAVPASEAYNILRLGGDMKGWLSAQNLLIREIEGVPTVPVYQHGKWIEVAQPFIKFPQFDYPGKEMPLWDGLQWLMVPMPTQIISWVGDHWELGPAPPIDSKPPAEPPPQGYMYVWTGSSWILADAELVAKAPMPAQFPVFDVGAKQWVLTSLMPSHNPPKTVQPV